MVVEIIQETARPHHDPRFGFMLFRLDEKDENRHLVIEKAFEQLAEQLLLQREMLSPQVTDCRPIRLLTCSFFAIDYF